MQTADAIIVGGGPGGSSCARALREAGLDVLVLDKAAFPRTKLCAGWVTPEALADLELRPEDYPHRFNTFERLRIHWKLLSLAPRSTQHSIRRYEFDDFLLQRTGARIEQHGVREIRKQNGDFVVDGLYRCRYLIGAAGTACPVYRGLFRQHQPRAAELQTATYELEFRHDWTDPDCHLWFFADGLPGYAWYVPKQDGYVNIGLGGMALQLRSRERRVQDYWEQFVTRLRRLGLVDRVDDKPRGYSYYLRGPVERVRDGNAFLVGDSAGLATRDLCEGIGPAVRSGLLAAAAIVANADYDLTGIPACSTGGWAARYLESRFTGSH